VCAVDENGRVVFEGKAASDPGALARVNPVVFEAQSSLPTLRFRAYRGLVAAEWAVRLENPGREPQLPPSQAGDVPTTHGLESFMKCASRAFAVLAFSVALLVGVANAAEIIPSARPEGGAGIFEGGSDNPSVDPATGILRTAIPFKLPIARGPLQPSLGLSYSSGLAKLEAGTGWGLGLPSIERHPVSGPPLYTDDDRISFSGKALVPICRIPDSLKCENAPAEIMPRWAFDWRYYRVQVEGAFARFFWSPDRLTWRVQLKSGETMEFGTPLVLQAIGGASRDIDRTIIPAAGLATYRWNLVRRFDTHDEPSYPNTIVYIWNQFGEINRLTDIFDTAPPRGGSTFAEYAHHTHLVWEGFGFPTYTYSPVWRAVQAERLKRVDVTSKNNAGVGPREMVRRYHLTYMKNRDGDYSPGKESPVFQRAFLQQVQMEGRCSETVQESDGKNLFVLKEDTNCPMLPPVRMEYTPGDIAPAEVTPDIRTVVDLHGPPFSGSSDLNPVAVMDVNGDGLPDVVKGFHESPPRSDDVHGVFFNSLTGSAGSPVRLDFAITGSDHLATAMGPTGQTTFLSARSGISVLGDWGNLSGPGVLWQRKVTPTGAEYCRVFADRAGGLEWNLDVSRCTTISQNLNLIADLDGDGLADGYGVENSNGKDHAFVLFSRRDLSSAPEFLNPFSDRVESNLILTDLHRDPPPIPQISLFADMNGDGIADYVTIAHNPLKDDQHVVYYPGDGRGNFLCDSAKDACENPAPPECPPGSAPSCSLPRVAASAAPGAPGMHPGSENVYIHDVNGDGLADIVQVSFSIFQGSFGGIGLNIWLNEDGRHFRKLHAAICNNPAGCPDAVVIDSEQPGLNLGNARIAFADMDGDGVDDIVFITPKSVFYIDMYRSHILTKVRPGLLSKIENGLGLVSEIKYRNLAELDQEAFRWKVGWVSDSPASSPVVTEVITRNQLPSPFGTERRIAYEYRDPAYDPWERRLLGFRSTVTTDFGPNLATTQVLVYSPCQPMRAAANCSRTSDNDELNAVTGVPVLIDTYTPKNKGDLVPGNFPSQAFVNFSTTHYTYESKILMTGSDGRAVNFAYPRQTDTYLYDAGNFQPTSQTVKYTDYEHTGPETVQKSEREVTTWSQVGREHLRTAQKIDSFGNVREAADFGRVDDAGQPLDDPIFTQTKFELQGATGWQWRPTTSTVSSGSGAGRPRTLDYSDNPGTGDLDEVRSELVGTLPLDRFHEDPSKKVAGPPQGASQDGKIRLSHLVYDKFGNVVLREGPQVTSTAGPSTRCQTLTYDGSYQQLPLTVTSYNGACTIAASQTASFEMDRGFGALTTVSTPSGAMAVTELEGFGRPIAIRRPAPGSVGAEVVPSVRIEYKLTVGGPVQKVHIPPPPD
jgi:hypothetical protein